MKGSIDRIGTRQPRRFQFGLRSLFLWTFIVASLLGTQFFGLVQLHYPRRIDNNPLRAPIRIVNVDPRGNDNTDLYLADGRILRFDYSPRSDILEAIQESDHEIDVETMASGDAGMVYVKRRQFICGTPWFEFCLIRIPLIPDDVPGNSRQWLGDALIDQPQRSNQVVTVP
jgi:hypothetical protein